jgi:hypothetical protein
MAPRISVRRKGDNIFLTIEGCCNCDSLKELLSVVRQLLMKSLKFTPPGSQITYCFKTSGKVDGEKLADFHPLTQDEPWRHEVCGDAKDRQEQEAVLLQGEPSPRQPRNGLTLVKGGAG